MKKKGELIRDEVSEEIIRITEHIATTEGAHNVTVRKILKVLKATNRVFYNRFHNVGEVLEIVYRNAVYRSHESLESKIDKSKHFFEYVTDVATQALIHTYEVKMKFSGYMFEHDSLTEANCNWWTDQISKLIEYAKENKLIKDVDTAMLSYTLWCFCRGYNVDSVTRKLSMEEAIKYFKFGFGCIINSLRIDNG